MADSRKIMINIPDSLLKEIDDIVCTEYNNRSEFIMNATRHYINEMKRTNFIDRMRVGYMEMAEINITISEVGLTADNETIFGYETRLAESE